MKKINIKKSVFLKDVLYVYGDNDISYLLALRDCLNIIISNKLNDGSNILCCEPKGLYSLVF